MDSPKIRWLRYVFPSIGIGIFIFILSRLDTSKLRAIYSASDVFLFILGLLVVQVSVFIRSLRHYILLRAQGVDIRFLPSLFIFFQSYFWGLLSPGHLGEFSKIAYLRPYSRSSSVAITNVFLDRIFDLLCIVGILGVSSFLIDLPERKRVFVGVAMVLSLGLGLYLVLRRWVDAPTISNSDRFRSFLREMIGIRLKGLILAMSLFVWLVNYYGMYLLAASIGVQASFPFIAFSVSASALVAILPISIFGIGTRDALLLYLFQIAALDREAAFLFSTFFLLVYLVQLCFACVVMVIATVPHCGETALPPVSREWETIGKEGS